MSDLKKTFLKLTALLAVGIAVLSGPVAGWLQMRELTIAPGERVQALYLVCGARAQHRRLYALLEYISAQETKSHAQIAACCSSGAVSPEKDKNHATDDMLLLVGNDAVNSLWSRREQRNLTRAEWAVRHLREALADDDGVRPLIVLVPGEFHGTDGEMEALAGFLARAPEIGLLALVTCPFHARRTVNRLRKYDRSGTEIRLVAIEGGRIDRNPLVVSGELLKMLRDAAGLSRARGLSRRRPKI